MLYNRKIIEEIKKWIPKEQIIILNGPRQVGKTSILKLLKEDITQSRGKEENVIFLNLEEIQVLNQLNSDPENILKLIENKNEKAYFFIDEIQYLDNPSNFLKHIYDKYKEKIKFIVTGSSSLDLKAKFQDSLVGRKITFLINPLDFEEFLSFKKFEYFVFLKRKDVAPSVKDKIDEMLEEYLMFGGMPAIALEDNMEMKEKMLQEYAGTYINKDVRSIGKLDNVGQFNKIVKILSSQIGSLLNINELSNTANISRREAEKYLDLLELTFVIDKIYSYSGNTRKQVAKMPKLYFFDLGVRNAILGNFLAMESRQDGGALFENFIFMEIKNKIAKDRIYFYRTVAKTEIDFVIEKNMLLTLIESKFKNLSKPIDERSLESFIKENENIEKAIIMSKNLNFENGAIKYKDYRFISDLL